MNSQFQKRQNRPNLRGIIAHILPLLIFLSLLVTAETGCTSDGPQPAALPPAQSTARQSDLPPVPDDQATIPALRVADHSAHITTPTTVPSITTIPTASVTLTPPLPATEMPAETVESQSVAPIEPPVPTGQSKQSPLPTPSGVYSWTLKVPILMYHYVSEPPDNADKYRKDLSVTPQDFEQQMAYLVENGYESVDLYDLSLAISAKKELPEKPVVITFDDGYLDNYENAFPILQDQGMTATFFVVTEFIDEGRAGYLNWEMVKDMSATGMRIEPHSKTHPDLSSAERDYAIYEALGSQETIAAQIGYTPRYFAYPSGRYDEETISIIEELDYWGAVTTADGTWHGFDDRFEWPRVRMRNTTNLAEFANIVNPADTVSGKSTAGT